MLMLCNRIQGDPTKECIASVSFLMILSRDLSPKGEQLLPLSFSKDIFFPGSKQHTSKSFERDLLEVGKGRAFPTCKDVTAL